MGKTAVTERNKRIYLKPYFHWESIFQFLNATTEEEMHFGCKKRSTPVAASARENLLTDSTTASLSAMFL